MSLAARAHPDDHPPSPSSARVRLHVVDLGRMPYAEAFEMQKRLQRSVIDARVESSDAGAPTEPSPAHVLLVEHDPPVITVTRRRGAAVHVVASPAALRAAGVEVVDTDRGGDVTYHGPGQLVVYPIVDLNALGLRVHGYMRLLEDVVIDVLAGYGIAGMRDPGATGVWVAPAESTAPAPSPPSKICAMGVRVSRWVAMHGLALNVTTDLDHFDLIVPCGLEGRTVTSMKRALGARCPALDDVKSSIARAFRTRMEAS